MIERILLNIPHSSNNFLSDEWIGDDVFEGVKRWTDHFTYKLFSTSEKFDGRIDFVVGKVNRFTCDFERLLTDDTNALGGGIVYKEYGNSRRMIDNVREYDIIKNIYLPYIEEIKNKLTPSTILIDCHSFPSDIAPDIDICIGFNDDWSKPDDDVIDCVIDHFSSSGLKVGVNEPYSNTISPKTDFYYSSIMIEVNKHLYMDQVEIKEFPDMYKLHIKILQLYRKILQNVV